MNATEEFAPAVRSILDAAARRTVPADRVSVDGASLSDALTTADADERVPLIAEVKPTSPTTEGTRTEDPVDLARAMVDGGAAALSVLTEPEHFGGSVENLERVREAVDVPVLRKDFLLEPGHLDAVEADAALVIARFVDDVGEMVAAARERGFEPLVEVHSVAELETALDADATLVGVNNRDLASLTVDLGTFERVAAEAPDDVTLVAESGISTPADVRRMRAAGADGLLVGSAIMAGEPRESTEELVYA
ncbi:indole-3-glycerol phosphate synthase [Haloarchaeobius salinus]|uniref:indole-3-glycerol phosphate synthase n=1 Tax=Haloarchaeobius salinus TaxID=1198298 RepID=UPI00210C903E|nr:indole-3-glycerol phosphate synthase [Haloarchaeobius salinus]